MNNARCRCGAISLSLRAPSQLVVACHCLDCQRRTGAPFSVGAFYAAEAVTISGTAKQYSRVADSGAMVDAYFCPTCGSTVYWKAERLPTMIGVAVGAMADPNFPAPARSVFEQSKHAWVELDVAGIQHFSQTSGLKTSN
jgi:hypothetical protein